MDFNTIIEEIKKKWTSSNNQNLIVELDNVISSGSTGMEITFMVGSFLVKLKGDNPSAYKIIISDIQDYLKLCKENGIKIVG